MRAQTAPRIAVPLVAALLAAAAFGACSSDGDGESTPTSSSTSGTSTTTTAPIECGPSEATPPVVEAVPDVPDDWTLVSFDDSRLRLHWYPADSAGPSPTLLQGPGWGFGGATATGGSGLFGDLSIASLRDAGYNVLTWDPRGFGLSTGTITVDDPEHEGRDVQRILDWLATLPEVELDAPGDPRVGMLGGSYGGGIQLAVAARDCRVDAIVPTIAWSSLRTSLYKNDTVKQGWAGALFSLAAERDLAPELRSSYADGLESGVISPTDVEFYESRGPGESVADIEIPTLIVQGTVDTLFTLDEAVANHEHMTASGDGPVAMLWYCGGHGVCLSEPGDAVWVGAATIAWLDRYVRGDESAELPPAFETVDQDGHRWWADAYPTPTGSIEGTGSGSLELVAEGGAGPASPPSGGGGAIGGVALAITPGRATNAVEVTLTAADAEAFVLGAPTVSITYSGTTPDGERPTRVFAQLVDDTNDLVLGNQITPIPVELDGKTHTIELPIETVAHRLDAGSSVTLQLVAVTTAYAAPRLGGTITFEQITVSLPTVDTLQRRNP
jgi:ABC-2 type transport system ATP-binding protein